MTGQEAQDDEPKVRIFVNSNVHMSRGKYAAAAVHAALTAAGVHPGLPVIVLGGQRDHVERMRTVIHDAGKTEVDPGTPTAGTDWSPAPEVTHDQEARHDEREALAYTPTTAEVREAVAEWGWSRRMFRPELAQSDGRELDRWLAAHDAAVLARKRPEPEITEEMVERAARQMRMRSAGFQGRKSWDETADRIRQGWRDAARDVLAAALRVPVGEEKGS